MVAKGPNKLPSLHGRWAVLNVRVIIALANEMIELKRFAACPLWVKSGHVRCKRLCPLWPITDIALFIASPSLRRWLPTLVEEGFRRSTDPRSRRKIYRAQPGADDLVSDKKVNSVMFCRFRGYELAVGDQVIVTTA